MHTVIGYFIRGKERGRCVTEFLESADSKEAGRIITRWYEGNVRVVGIIEGMHFVVMPEGGLVAKFLLGIPSYSERLRMEAVERITKQS